MPRPLLGLIVLLVVVGLGIGLYCWNRTPSEKLELIQEPDANAVVNEAALPVEAITIDLAESAKLEPPFVLSPDATAAGGMALTLPKGSRDENRTSHAKIPFTVRAAGNYSLWLRAYWTDSCSNSISARLNDAPEKNIGNDELFNVWHWVPAGQFALKEGTNELVLREREGGIALDQMLLVRDPAFHPTGRIERAAGRRKDPVSEPVQTRAKEPTGHPPTGEHKAIAAPPRPTPVSDAALQPADQPEKRVFTRTVRRFADDFTRSPAHGIGDWNHLTGKWEILFSFDPNRIPLQYALSGKPEGATSAVTLIKSPPWSGARMAFTVFPQSAGTFGVILDRSADGKQALQVLFDVTADSAKVTVSGNGQQVTADLKGRLRLNQWHSIAIDRWAWVLSVSLDETPVLTRTDLPVPAGDIGFTVASGSTVFDDVKVEELAWQADDGLTARIPWKPAAGATWFRREQPGAGPTLLGRGGAISTGLPPLKAVAVLVDERVPGTCRVDCAGLVDVAPTATPRILRPAPFTEPPAGLSLAPAGEADAQLRRIAIAYTEPLTEEVVIGPYTFNERTIPDPSDYLDFTPEEHRQMRNLPEAEKYRRGQKPRPVIAYSRGQDNWNDDSPWRMDRGQWRLLDQTLQGVGQGALLSYADELFGTYEVRMKVRLPQPSSAAQVMLCGDIGKPHLLRLVREKPSTAGPAAPAVQPDPFDVAMKADGGWHQVCIRAGNGGLAAAVDGGEWRTVTSRRGDAGFFALGVQNGRVDFDDVEFHMPRRSPDGRNYSFANGETDWWREAHDSARWMDHGGISCRLASSWVSLVAPQGGGMIWNKHTFGPDVAVASNITEWSEWYGWDRNETHRHLPYDNICLVLGTERDEKTGYRLEINSNNRTETVLYRSNQPVARIAQDDRFPMRYFGGHFPYFPRRHWIGMLKRGGEVQGIVDGKVILSYTDPDPLPVSRIGFGGYRTHINFGPITIRLLNEKPAVTPPKS